MSDEGAQAPAAVLGSSSERTLGRSKYFLGVAVLLLALVVTGFGKTFFARAFFDVPPIPWFLFAHGFVLASWFLLLVAQTVLVAAHRTDLHRRLGVLGGVVAVALVGVSLVAVLGFPAHVKANILTSDIVFDTDTTRSILWTDLASLVIFSTFVGTALYRRGRSDVHKRLMVLASMAILGPAIARILPLVASSQAVGGVILTLAFVGLPLSVAMYDLLATRRVHRTTVVGIVASLVATFGALAISSTGVGAALVTALE